jgi:hypothetical protein
MIDRFGAAMLDQNLLVLKDLFHAALIQIVSNLPRSRADIVTVQTGVSKGVNEVCFGSLADISQCNRYVGFTLESGHDGYLPRRKLPHQLF